MTTYQLTCQVIINRKEDVIAFPLSQPFVKIIMGRVAYNQTSFMRSVPYIIRVVNILTFIYLGDQCPACINTLLVSMIVSQ